MEIIDIRHHTVDRRAMTVTVEIRTDARRVIDYLLSPLAKMGSEALRER